MLFLFKNLFTLISPLSNHRVVLTHKHNNNTNLLINGGVLFTGRQ